MVLDLGGEDSITGPEVFQPPTEGDGVQRRGRTPGEDHFSRVVGADEAGDTGPGRLIGICRGDRELVGPAVDIGV